MTYIVGAIAALAGLFWAVSRLLTAAQEAKAAGRRFSWSRKVDKRIVDTLDDPREAAAILLVQIAAYEGEISAAQKDSILTQMKACFRISEEEGEELFAIARRVMGETNDVANFLNRVLAPIRESCTQMEQMELLEMMRAVSHVEAEPSTIQRTLIGQVERALRPDR